MLAFAEGYTFSRQVLGNSDDDWGGFVHWLGENGWGQGGEGWDLAIPRKAREAGRDPADVFCDLVEAYLRLPSGQREPAAPLRG